MKMFLRALLAVLALVNVASFAATQIQPGAFKHIIIVIQENRTPDNLFGAGAGSSSKCVIHEDPFEPGVDIVNGGQSHVDGTICSVQQPMNTPTLDPGHFYHDWAADYDSGSMDGFCHTYTNGVTKYVACPTTQPSSYSYIQLRTYSRILILPRRTASPITCSRRMRAQAFPRISLLRVPRRRLRQETRTATTSTSWPTTRRKTPDSTTVGALPAE